MRKRRFALLVGILAVTLLLTACAGVNLTLTFEVDGEAYATVTTSGQEAVKMPKDPVKEGYRFDGWYWDKDVWEKPFTVNSLLETPLTENMTVYAKWKKEAEEHVHSFGEWTEVTPSTCAAEGLEKRVCECGEEETRPIQKLPHSFGEWTVETPATCTAEGLEKNVCSVCETEETRITEKLPHSFGEWAVETAATCTAEGTEKRVCGICDTEETHSIEILPHSFGEWVVATAATCTAEGTEKRVCGICDTEETHSIEILPHSFGEWVVATAATCTVEGTEKRVCGVCGTEDTRTVAVISHNYNINNDEVNHWLECSVCSNKKDKERHTYENAICEICGNEYVTIGLEYEKVSGGYEVEGIGTVKESKIVISSTYEGEPVIGIGSSAFYNCRSIVSVEIPKSVTSIGSFAFSGCSSLISIEIPSSVTSISDRAFDGCSSLTKVEISDIAAWCGIEFGRFNANPLSYAKHLYINGEEVTELVIPEKVTSIGSSAFRGCSSLKSVVIPNSVTRIGKHAFYECYNLESITIPYVGATKDGTSDKHFGYIFGATSDGGNTDSVPKTLKTVIITGGTSIGSNAFGGCDSLVNIKIPSGVTSIGSFAFSGCSSLKSIEIPKSVTNIGEQAFRECRNMESIEYGGTKAEWYAITKGDFWSFHTGNYSVTCADGMLSKEESKLQTEKFA